MLRHCLAAFRRFLHRSPVERLDERLSNAETAVSNAERKASELAVKVAKMEGRIDPLSSFVQALEDFHRHGYPRENGSSRHNIEG